MIFSHSITGCCVSGHRLKTNGRNLTNHHYTIIRQDPIILKYIHTDIYLLDELYQIQVLL